MSLYRLVLVSLLVFPAQAVLANGLKTVKLELMGSVMFDDDDASLTQSGRKTLEQVTNTLSNSNAQLYNIVVTTHAEPRQDAERYAKNMAQQVRTQFIRARFPKDIIEVMSLGAEQPSRQPSAKKNTLNHRRVSLTISGNRLPRLSVSQSSRASRPATRILEESRPSPLPKKYIALLQSLENRQITEHTYQSNWLFTRNGANLSKAAKRKLTGLARSVKKMRDAKRLVVLGHANGFANEKINRTYSLSHAQAVAEYLRQRGVTLPATVMSLGSTLPYAEMTTAQGRKKNRRVEVIIVSKRRVPTLAGDNGL